LREERSNLTALETAFPRNAEFHSSE
jgi:hypothetical protein